MKLRPGAKPHLRTPFAWRGGRVLQLFAGLVLAHTGVVPEVGEVVTHGQYDLVVEEADGRKITRVRIRQTEN